MTPLISPPPPPHYDRQYYWSSVALIVGVPAMGDFLFGFDVGVTSYAVVLWKAAGLEPLWIGILVSGPATGALLASFVVFSLADRIGRRTELQLAAGLYFVGAVLESFSGVVSSNRDQIATLPLSMLLLGRWIYGAAIAFALHGATTYVGEMVPSSIRGPIMSLNEVSIVTGILFGYLVGNACSSDASWAPLYASSLLVSIAMLWLSSCFLHESPRWLTLKGKTEEALEALRFVFEPEGASQQHQQLLSTHRPQASAQSYKLLRHHRPALVAGLGIVALLQLTGQPTVLTYASPLLQEAGLAASSAVLVALFKIVVTFVAVFTVEQQGRKKLLYIGCGLMLVGLIVLSMTFSSSQANNHWHNTLVLSAMFVYIGGYQIGFGTMVWLITLEVFPMAIRGPAVALAVQTNFGLHALMELLVPLLQDWFGTSVVFGIFGVATASAIVFVFRYVPETKGLSLEEIEQQFAARSRAGPSREELHPIINGTSSV